jgi:site-specific recombinase XerD
MLESKQQSKTVKNFEEYLLHKGYSKNVIPIYGRKLNDFLTVQKPSFNANNAAISLKETISAYLNAAPFDQRKRTMDAALHTFYYSITGEYFQKRLKKVKGFDHIEKEIEKFRIYLFKTRGLGEGTVSSTCSTVKLFLYSVFYKKKHYSYQDLNFHQIQRYLLRTIAHVCPSSKKTMLTRIRTFFKFIEFEYGVRNMEIMELPLITPVKKMSSIPKYLTNDETDLLLNTYDKSTSVGIRNYAIARCFSDLALRCSEIAKLTLDDFNWAVGTVTIKGTKSHSERILPFNMVTGKSIESYLTRARPLTEDRILFLRFKKEASQVMGVIQIRETVRRSAVRAGLRNFKGTHMLRHKAARDMIINGIGIKTIADILGHDSIETTLIYTKVNSTELIDVAGNWPEVKNA